MASYRYWRIRSRTTQATAFWAQGEIELRDAGGVDLTGAGTVTVSNSFDATNNPPTNLFDDNPSTWWATASGGATTGFVMYDFGAPVEVRSVAFTARNDTNFAQGTRTGVIEGSDDGASWTEMKWYSVPAYTMGSTVTTDVPVLPAEGVARVYGLGVQVLNTGPNPKARVYSLGVEVLRSIAQESGTDGKRYWRIRQVRNANGTGFSGLAEIELRRSAAEANLINSQSVVTCSLPPQAGLVSSLIDGDYATRLQVSATGLVDYTVDLGPDRSATVNEVRLVGNPDSLGRSPGFFEVQSSDDGVTFQTEWVCYAPTAVWTPATPIAFTRPTAQNHRYWMMRALNVDAGVTLGAREVEFREVVGGPDITTGLSASAFSMTAFSSSFDASKAFDDNQATAYSGASAVEGSEFLAIDFGVGQAKDVREISITSRSDGTGTTYDQAPHVGQMLSSPDGRNWVKRWSFTFPDWTSGGQTQQVNITESPEYTPPPTSVLNRRRFFLVF